jgi:hypothetical protein
VAQYGGAFKMTADNSGLTIAEALKSFSDPVLWSKYLESRQPSSKTVSYFDAKAIRNIGIGTPPPVDTSEDLHDQLVQMLLNLFRSEKIWSTGYTVPVGLDDLPMLVPANKWRVLNLEVESASASGGELKFVGLRVFDSLQDATEFCVGHDALEPLSMKTHTQYKTPYLEFMERAVRELELAPDKVTPKDQIIFWLRDNWPPEFGEISEREIEKMATFLREPLDKKGGFYKGLRKKGDTH